MLLKTGAHSPAERSRSPQLHMSGGAQCSALVDRRSLRVFIG